MKQTNKNPNIEDLKYKIYQIGFLKEGFKND